MCLIHLWITSLLPRTLLMNYIFVSNMRWMLSSACRPANQSPGLVDWTSALSSNSAISLFFYHSFSNCLWTWLLSFLVLPHFCLFYTSQRHSCPKAQLWWCHTSTEKPSLALLYGQSKSKFLILVLASYWFQASYSTFLPHVLQPNHSMSPRHYNHQDIVLAVLSTCNVFPLYLHTPEPYPPLKLQLTWHLVHEAAPVVPFPLTNIPCTSWQ